MKRDAQGGGGQDRDDSPDAERRLIGRSATNGSTRVARRAGMIIWNQASSEPPETGLPDPPYIQIGYSRRDASECRFPDGTGPYSDYILDDSAKTPSSVAW